MSDPLKLLREYIIAAKPIKEKDDYIIFGDTAFSKTAKTNYLVWNKKDDYYTLDSLYFFYKKRALQHTAYVKEAAEKKIQIVTRADRKALEDYLLKDKLEKLPTSIDLSAPVPTSVHVSKIPSDADHADSAKRPRLDYDEVARKPSERVLAMLEGTSRAQASKPDAIRDLSMEHGLTKDKIAALRQKALANKRNQIKSTEEELMMASESFDALSFGGPLVDLTKEVTGRERFWRSRSSCLEAASKNFGKSVLPVLQTVRAREDPLMAPQDSLNGPNSQNIPTVMGPDGKTISKSSSGNTAAGYSRYDQERFRKEETEGFQINTMGTYRGITLKSITEGAKPKPQSLPSASNGGAKTAPVPNAKAGQSDSRSVPVTSHRSAESPVVNGKPHKRTSRTPIIIIPAASTSLVTMYNARDLLHDLKFVSTEEKKVQGAKRENDLLIQRQKENHVTAPYRIVDNPLKLTTEEWERVVAVFVQGPAWQFKEWPFASPSDIFAKICAFHLKWDDHNLDANVARWNVAVVALSRTKRHLDRASLIKIWDAIDRHILKHKPFLRH